MSVVALNGKMELELNAYLVLVNPKTKDVLDKVDNVKEIYVFVDNIDYTQDMVLKIINYGDHIRVIEHYKSVIGEVNIERAFDNIKPSMILRMLFPSTFK